MVTLTYQSEAVAQLLLLLRSIVTSQALAHGHREWVRNGVLATGCMLSGEVVGTGPTGLGGPWCMPGALSSGL